MAPKNKYRGSSNLHLDLAAILRHPPLRFGNLTGNQNGGRNRRHITGGNIRKRSRGKFRTQFKRHTRQAAVRTRIMPQRRFSTNTARTFQRPFIRSHPRPRRRPPPKRARKRQVTRTQSLPKRRLRPICTKARNYRRTILSRPMKCKRVFRYEKDSAMLKSQSDGLVAPANEIEEVGSKSNSATKVVQCPSDRVHETFSTNNQRSSGQSISTNNNDGNNSGGENS